MFVELSYEYAWIIPSCPLISSGVTGLVSFFFPKATKGLRRLCATFSILSLTVSPITTLVFFWEQSISHSTQQYLWSRILRDDISLKIGFSIDPLTLIMSVPVTTVGILVMIYSDSYMSHDQGYVRFFTYLSLFAASMLGLVFSPNSVQIYVFWELVGMCSYLLIGFWFARPSAANACQKAFVTNRIGDFGMLLGILGTYWLTGSFEIRELCDRFSGLVTSGSVNPVLANTIALSLSSGPVAKSAQFPLHVWLPDAMEGPTPISAIVHAATMVAAGIFFVARIFDLIESLPFSMSVISWVGAITALLGSTLALTQRDLKKGLAYSTMSQLGYMVLASGIGAYRSASFHLITHAYSKASSFLGSGSVIHAMEKVVGYSPNKSQNMLLMGGLRKYMPITGTTFLLGTLSMCGVPPLACFWSKDEIIAESWLNSPYLGWITSVTASFTAFYMFRIYLLTFEGNLRMGDVQSIGMDPFQLLESGISLWGETRGESAGVMVAEIREDTDPLKENLIQKETDKADSNVSPKRNSLKPKESDFVMLLPLVVSAIFTSTAGFIGVNVFQKEAGPDSLSEWLIPLVVPKNEAETLIELLTNSIGSVSFSLVGIFISYAIYGSSSFFGKILFNKIRDLNRNLFDSVGLSIQSWSLNRGYIDYYYKTYFIDTTLLLSKSVLFFDQWIVDGIVNGTGVLSLFGGGGARYGGGGRISYYSFGLITGLVSLVILATRLSAGGAT
uniref:NAD(P)H-quinone oxidoreductase subunit 5, chloroplastic n=1 Tax=Marsilea crenata TaxID=388472 RepID=S4UFW2_MARCR|nr:NADH-plastoquinone oxidoreductase subunit 5 [Marsilea crenata]AGI51482.1 NADH-plastoquinone oxidoreductase subunit 5 [Marsilea crenata]